MYCLLSLNKNVVFTRKGTPCALTGVSLQQLIDTKLERFNTIFSFIPNELKNKYGSRLIREAAYCGNDEIVLKLSDSIPKKFLNKADQNGRTVMHFASRKCAPETLIYLIKEKGAFFKNPDLSNRTPLHHASIVGIKAS